MTEGIKMKDGKLAWLTESGHYYARRNPDYENHTSIGYYDLEGNPIPLASAACPECHDTITSKRCGDFVTCKCGKSSVDTDRLMPERHRFIGLVADLPAPQDT